MSTTIRREVKRMDSDEIRKAKIELASWCMLALFMFLAIGVIAVAGMQASYTAPVYARIVAADGSQMILHAPAGLISNAITNFAKYGTMTDIGGLIR